MEKRKWSDMTNKFQKASMIFGIGSIGFLVIVIFLVVACSPKSEYDKLYSDIYAGLKNLGYVKVKQNEEYSQFKLDMDVEDHWAYVDFGVNKFVTEEFQSLLEGRVSFSFGRIEKDVAPQGKDRWDFIKKTMIENQELNSTIRLLGDKMAGSQIPFSEIIAGIDNKIAKKDYSLLSIKKGRYTFQVRYKPDSPNKPDVRCRYLIDKQ